MTLRNYLLLSAGITIAWVLALLFIPAFARTIESLMLMFLSSNA
jgi:hypothetical protein